MRWATFWAIKKTRLVTLKRTFCQRDKFQMETLSRVIQHHACEAWRDVQGWAGCEAAASRGSGCSRYFVCMYKDVAIKAFFDSINRGLMLWSQFSAIFDNFRRKKWRFSRKPMLWSKFCIIYIALFCVKKANFFAEFFGENIFKNHNIGPRSRDYVRKCKKWERRGIRRADTMRCTYVYMYVQTKASSSSWLFQCHDASTAILYKIPPKATCLKTVQSFMPRYKTSWSAGWPDEIVKMSPNMKPNQLFLKINT
jgi:hypothetical protein